MTTKTRASTQAKTDVRSDFAKADDGRLSTQQVANIAGVKTATLDYWLRTGLVEPSNTETATPGEGVHRRFDLRDVVAVCTIATLRDRGVNVRRLRRVQAALRAYERDFANARLALVTTGPEQPYDVALVSTEAEKAKLATSLLDSPGQTLVTSLELRDVYASSRTAFRKALREKPAIRGRRKGVKYAPKQRKAAAG